MNKTKPILNSKLVNIVCISDNNYIIPTGITLWTLYQNRNPNRKYCIYLLHNNIEKKYIDYFKKLNDKNFNIVLKDIEYYDYFKDFQDHSLFSAHVSKLSLLKFHIADIFKDIKKILYLDVDLLIKDDLCDLFDTDIRKQYCAVSKCPLQFLVEKNTRFIKKNLNNKINWYFNSGVMLLNLEKMRNDNIVNSLIEYRKKSCRFMDQDALNAAFSNNKKKLSMLYNMSLSEAINIWKSNFKRNLFYFYGEFKFTSAISLYKKAKILHFAYNEKPWIYNNVFGSYEWICYYRISPFYDSSFTREPIEYSSMHVLKDTINFNDVFSKRDIIIPCPDSKNYKYVIKFSNNEDIIETCLDIVILNSKLDENIIFINDNSSDDTENIIKRYSSLDGRIHIESEDNHKNKKTITCDELLN